MKNIIIIISLFLSFVLYAQSDFFSIYLDSLEIAFDKDERSSIKRYSDILSSYDSERYEPYYYIAFTLYKSGDIIGAEKYADRAVALEPSQANYALLSKILYQLDKSKFIEKINHALKVYPVSLELLSMKMDYFNRSSQTDSANQYAKIVYKNNPSDMNAVYALAKYESSKSNYDGAIQYLAKLINNPKPELEHYMLAGRIYRDARNYQLSNKYFRKLISTEYDYTARHNIADNYYTELSADSAINTLYQLIDAYPESISAYSKILAISFNTKSAFLTDSLFAFINKSKIEDSTLLENMSSRLFSEDKYESASKLYRVLCENHPQYSSREAVQTFYFMKNYDASLSYLERLKLLTLKDSIFYGKFKGSIFFKKMEYDSSEEYFEKTYYMIDSDTILLVNLANAYYANAKMIKLQDLINSIQLKYPSIYLKLNEKYFKAKE